MKQPIDVAILASTNEIAVCEYDPHIVSIHSLDTGKLVCSFGSEGTQDGQFRRPVCITSDAHGNLLVSGLQVQ
jgi:hypothetical protein